MRKERHREVMVFHIFIAETNVTKSHLRKTAWKIHLDQEIYLIQS